MDNINEIISYTKFLYNSGPITTSRMNELFHLIETSKCDFILQNINSEPLKTIITTLKTIKIIHIIKDSLNELLKYLKHYSSEIYNNTVIQVHITRKNDRKMIEYKYCEFDDFLYAKIMRENEKNKVKDLIANAKYIILQSESRKHKYLLDEIDTEGKIIIYIESFFPTPMESHNILFDDSNVLKQEIDIYSELFGYIIDFENRKANKAEYENNKEKLLKGIESCDNVWTKIKALEKSINK